MADEVSRQRSVRRITAPGDTGTYIDLKIIDEITFKEQLPPYQEWVLGFKNIPDDAARTVRVVEVGEDKLRVERIDTLDTTETTGRQQEAIWSFLNNENPPVHLETHTKKIYASDGNGTVTDTGTWIEVQRIDKIEFVDQQDEVRGQEAVWSLSNPDLEDADDDYKNLTSPINDWNGTTINPPWRLDPFQTIVDCSFERLYMLVLYQKGFSVPYIAAIPMKNIDNPVGHVYTNRVSTGSFGSNYSLKAGCAQLKIASDLHVAMTSLNFDRSGNISLSNYRNFYNTKNTLLGPAASATANPNLSKKPKFNFTGKVIFDDAGNRVDFSSSSPVVSTPRAWVKSPDSVAAVAADGGLWGYGYVEFYFRYLLGVNYYFNTISDSQYSAYPIGSGMFAGSVGPGEDDISIELFPAVSSTVNGSKSFEQKIMVYSNDGQTDKLSLGSAGMFCSTSSNSSTGYKHEEFSILGLSGSYTLTSNPYSETWSGYSGIDLEGSYSFGANAADNIMSTTVTYPSSQRTIITPAGTYTEAAAIPGAINFCANGKTSFKYIGLSYNERNFLVVKDREDYTDKLCSALGINYSSDWIVCMMLDIKKSDIDKLK